MDKRESHIRFVQRCAGWIAFLGLILLCIMVLFMHSPFVPSVTYPTLTPVPAVETTEVPTIEVPPTPTYTEAIVPTLTTGIELTPVENGPERPTPTSIFIIPTREPDSSPRPAPVQLPKP